MAKARTKLAVQMSNSDASFNRRADSKAEQYRIAQQSIIDSMKKEFVTIELELDDLMDFSPKSKDSLEPAHADKNADQHMCKIQEMKMKLYQLKIGIQMAEETYKFYFELSNEG